MNNLSIKIKKPVIHDFTWRQAVNKLILLAEENGICNMIAAAPKALEEMEEDSVGLHGHVHYETELSKNRTFVIGILERAMNCCDIDEENATQFDRIHKAKEMRDSLNEYIAELEK